MLLNFIDKSVNLFFSRFYISDLLFCSIVQLCPIMSKLSKLTGFGTKIQISLNLG